jgi:hypothetical protein
LDEKVNALQAGLNNAQLNFASDTTLLDLIRNNSTNINDILTGKVNVNLTYNTDVVRAGEGITIDYSVPNQISVKNKNQEYSSFATCLNASDHLEYSLANGTIPGATADGNRILIGPFTNYYRNVGATASTLFDNLIINLDDTNYRWKKGQTLRIVFEDDIDLDTYQINIKTDSQNIIGSGNYGVSVGNLTVADLVTTKPILDIICVDPASYTFYIDVIK